MEGCLQAIRHGSSPVTWRQDWISSRGDLPHWAGRCQGLSNTCARWCDERSCDCFLTSLIACQEASVAYAVRNRCTIRGRLFLHQRDGRADAHLTQCTNSNTIRGLRLSSSFITICDTLMPVLLMKPDNKPQPWIYLPERAAPGSCSQ